MDAAPKAPSKQVWPQSMLDLPLNRAATRLLKMRGISVFLGTMPLSQAVAEGLNHWNPRGKRETQAASRLAKLAEAGTPAQFAEAIRPFMNPLAWDPKQAEREGLPPYSPETLGQFTPTNMDREAGKCKTLAELLNILEGQEAKTYEMST